MLVPMLIIFGLVYLLVIRPLSKKASARRVPDSRFKDPEPLVLTKEAAAKIFRVRLILSVVLWVGAGVFFGCHAPILGFLLSGYAGYLTYKWFLSGKKHDSHVAKQPVASSTATSITLHAADEQYARDITSDVSFLMGALQQDASATSQNFLKELKAGASMTSSTTRLSKGGFQVTLTIANRISETPQVSAPKEEPNDLDSGGQKVLRGSQRGFFGNTEWTLTFTTDSLQVASVKDKESIAIPRSQSATQVEFYSRQMWGYDVKIRLPKAGIKLQLSRGVRAFLKSWINAEDPVDLEQLVRSSRYQAKIGLLHWIYLGGFRSYRTWPGAKRTRTGQIILFVSVPTILAGFRSESDSAKRSNILLLLVIAIGISLFVMWKGYQEYCDAHEKNELDEKIGL